MNPSDPTPFTVGGLPRQPAAPSPSPPSSSLLSSPPQLPRAFWPAAWHRLLRNRLATASLVILALTALFCIAGPWLSPYTYERTDLDLGPTAPSAAHWLGTDVLGRDLLVRLLYGGRISLLVGFCATAVSLLVGFTYGALSGYTGGRVDTLMMRAVDTLYSLPFSMLVIVLLVVFGNNFVLLFVAIGLVEWLTMARIVRGQVLSLRELPFIKAGKVLGYSTARIITRHVLPNVIGPVVVYTTLTVPQVILLESFLSFLGLGVQKPMSSWGGLIHDGAASMESYPWLLITPGLCLSLTLFALNFVGDGLRDALDPRFIARRTSR